GSVTILAIALRHMSTSSFGVPAGATMPVSVSLSRSGTPASPLVGKSGRSVERLLASKASPRNLPSLILLIAGGRAVNQSGVGPPSGDVPAGAAPGNGTITRSGAYFSLKSSPARCGVEPVPGWAKLYFPGLALITSTRSFRVRTGTAGLTNMTFGDDATS